jgi:hypothetical protein
MNQTDQEPGPGSPEDLWILCLPYSAFVVGQCEKVSKT